MTHPRMTNLAHEIGQALIAERRAVSELRKCQARVRDLLAQRELMEGAQRRSDGGYSAKSHTAAQTPAATHTGRPAWRTDAEGA